MTHRSVTYTQVFQASQWYDLFKREITHCSVTWHTGVPGIAEFYGGPQIEFLSWRLGHLHRCSFRVMVSFGTHSFVTTVSSVLIDSWLVHGVRHLHCHSFCVLVSFVTHLFVTHLFLTHLFVTHLLVTPPSDYGVIFDSFIRDSLMCLGTCIAAHFVWWCH